MTCFAYGFSKEEALERLGRASRPLDPNALHRKDALLSRIGNGRLLLVRTGSAGRRRPQQAFFGRLRSKGEGTELRGRFGILPADFFRLLVPSLLLLGGACGASLILEETLYRLLFIAAALLSLGLLWGFSCFMTHYMAAEERALLLRFLEHLETNEGEEGETK